MELCGENKGEFWEGEQEDWLRFVAAWKKQFDLDGAEVKWLQDIYAFVKKSLLPLAGTGGLTTTDTCESLATRLVHLLCQQEHKVKQKETSETNHSPSKLPTYWRPITLLELQSFCRTPHEEVPPAFLLGWLSDRPLHPLSSDNVVPLDCHSTLQDGNLFICDASAQLHCEFHTFSLCLLGHLLLLCSFSFIPYTWPWCGLEPRGCPKGYLEVHAEPHVLSTAVRPTTSLQKEPIISVLYSDMAALLLAVSSPCHKARIALRGEISALSPVFSVRLRRFFFIRLSSTTSSTSVICVVKNPDKLVWHSCLRHFEDVIITNVYASSLKSIQKQLFVASSDSQLKPARETCTKPLALKDALQTCGLNARDFHVMAEVTKGRGVEMRRVATFEGEVEMVEKDVQSRVCSYQGQITAVLYAMAGLYELDNKVGLCLAYQPCLGLGKGLRLGAVVQIHDAHLLKQQWCSQLPPTLLMCCARSLIRVVRWSTVTGPLQPFPFSHSPIIHVLYRAALPPEAFFHLVSATHRFLDRFCPNMLSEKSLNAGDEPHLLERLFLGQRSAPDLRTPMLSPGPQRNIYREVLDEPHCCITDRTAPPFEDWQLPALAEIPGLVEQTAQENIGVDEGEEMVSEGSAWIVDVEGKPRVKHKWSFCTLLPTDFHPRLVLLAVLGYDELTASLSLQDQTGCLPCQVVQTAGVPCFEPELLDCLLRIDHFSVVLEIFSREYDMNETRVYVTFSVEHAAVIYRPHASCFAKTLKPILPKVHTTSPSLKNYGSKPNPAAVWQRDEKENHAGTSKQVRSSFRGLHQESDMKLCQGLHQPSCSTAIAQPFTILCKEKLTHRMEINRESADSARPVKALAFSAQVRSLAPALRLYTGQEKTRFLEYSQNYFAEQVQLQFVGRSVCWFPFLHPTMSYYLIVKDSSELEQGLVVGQHTGLLRAAKCPCTLIVQPHWTFKSMPAMETKPWAEISAADHWKTGDGMMSILGLLELNFSFQLVSFPAVILKRLTFHPDDCFEVRTPNLASLGQEEPWTPNTLSLRLDLSDPSDPNVSISLYFDPGTRPLGLLPGSKILLHNVEHKISKRKNVYCRFINTSVLTVISFPPSLQKRITTDETSFTRLYLRDIRGSVQGMQQAVCSITRISRLTLRWNCIWCGKLFTKGRCAARQEGFCSSDCGRFGASASVVVDDGTAESLALVEAQQVAVMLGLTAAEWKVLKDEVWMRGELEYSYNQQFHDPVADPLWNVVAALCCKASSFRRFNLSFCLKKQLHHQDVSEKTFQLGEMRYATQLLSSPVLFVKNITPSDWKALVSHWQHLHEAEQSTH
uniref:CST complex subunit CTC1 n=1 Tax=Myxine glutinosa TaxID=7769 RepID=UPI00358E9220